MTENNAPYKVSIIMPTYNRADLIQESINSILHQTYTNWELIIVDDGSIDHTREVVRSINDSRIHIFQQEHSGVVGKSRNFGISQATGDLIAFNDSDDLWKETKLEKQVEALVNHPEAAFCLTNGFNFYKPGEPVEFFYKERSGVRLNNLFYSCFQSKVAGFTQALMLRHDCLTIAGRFKEDKKFSDFDFIINLAQNFKGVLLYEPLVYRRLHGSNSNSTELEKEYHHAINMINGYRESLPPKILKNAFFRLHMNFGVSYLKNGDTKKAINLFLKAWVYKRLSLAPMKKILRALLAMG
jgi:glycosyltransferase involved in cell wall biosynthesis